uniref:Uncharacterized protein n=1 Tax=Rhizophora mucronata TaxID=61149 RepID=A0A2P2MFY3_RHIMU
MDWISRCCFYIEQIMSLAAGWG